ncbi:MAG: T9SS type A sorting domain-containing protein, partial [Crocinitomicaceae bacterium]
REIQVYPNPANEQITISVNKGRLGKILIYNQLGQEIVGFQCDSNSKLIDLSNYQNGLYFLNFPEKGISLKFTKGH